ncbi:MAG: nitrate- and nitrite sensing domain-containing protein [Arcobacteraceae bacterium]|nr:nitrate- and nitrite sensing domain-containing protein [Arcobacteraceae bacterium]
MFKNMSIKAKLSLLVIIPVIALSIIAGNSIITNIDKASSFEDLQKVVVLSTKVSALVHETQKERGATAGFIGSKGKKFADTLPKQRKLTNKRVTELKKILSSIDLNSINKNIANTINSAMSDMSKIDNIRTQVSSLSIPTPKAIGYYTKMNAKFLNSVIEISKISQAPEVTKQLVAYANFLLSKERAGIERAVGTNTLARDTFGPGMRIKFNNLIAAQDSFMNNFLQYASKDAKSFYNKTLKGDAVNEVNRIREVLLNAQEVGGFNIVATYWFDTITKKIGLLKKTENYIVQNLRITDKNLEKQVKLVVAVSNLLHETQKERGATAGFIGSKGKKFVKKLPNQRELTNSRVNKLKDTLQKYKRLLSPEASKYLDKALNQLNKISDIRNKVNTLSIPASKAIGFYTNMNAAFLDTVGAVTKVVTNKDESRDLTALYNFIMSKERAGIERAVLSNTFARNKFLPGMKDKFIKLMTEQNSFLTSFKKSANPNFINFYNKTLKGDAVDKVNSMRKIAKDAVTIGGFGEDSGYWFKTITAKINLLKRIDDNLAKELLVTIKSELDEVNTALITAIIFNILFIIISIVIALIIMKGITSSIKIFQTGLLDFFKYINKEINDVNDIKIESNDEIGHMAEVVNENISKTKDLIEQDKKVIDEIDDVIEKVNNGFFQYNIKQSTTNLQVEELKNKINDMIISTNKKLKVINKTLIEYGQSNFAYQIPISDDLNGEFGTIAAGSKLLGNNVSELVAMIKLSGNALNDDTKILAHSSSNLSNASNQQAANLEETAAALEEITANISSSTQSVTKMAQYANSVTTSVSSGQVLANKTANSMEEINKEVSSISEAITVVDQIAFQTNILSLNAAVEAATAGEAGKGFAVVAQEVRNLASRSADAANEIKALVANANIKANEGKSIADEMIDGYSYLNESISKTLELISDVETASKEQQTAIMQINDSVSSLDGATQQNAMEAANIKALADKVSNLATNLTDISEHTQFKEEAMQQICNAELSHITSNLKNDHLKFKETNYAKLGTNQVWKVVDHHSCNLGKWIDKSEAENKEYTQTQNWTELKQIHQDVHNGVQNYINEDAKFATNEILNKIAVGVERSIIGVFDHLNMVKADSCKGQETKKRKQFRKKTVDTSYTGPDRREIEKNIKEHHNTFVPKKTDDDWSSF